MLTLDQFKQMIPSNTAATEWYAIASDLFSKYDIVTKNRIAGFMAQAAQESGDFKTLQENLNYSASGLLKTFSKYFTPASAKDYAKKPEAIANIVYADANRKNKLGNTQPGDGWRFRGRGLFQLTGRWNYENFGKTIGKTAEDTAAYLETKQGAFESALWYWTTNKLNRFADANDIEGLSKAVNGGDIGLSERIAKYNRNKAILEAFVATPTEPQVIEVVSLLQRGSRGDIVKQIQAALRLPADGVYGIITEAAVRSWQRTNKYSITGKLDTEQIRKILGA